MSEKQRRVVITGMGLISPLGNTKESLWDHLRHGRSGATRFEGVLPQQVQVNVAAPAADFTGHIDQFGELEKPQSKAIRKALKMMCRESQMAVAAAQLALSDAGIRPGSIDPERMGAVFGSDYMLTLPEEFAAGISKCSDSGSGFEFGRWGEEGLEEMTPLWLLKYLPNMPASHVAIFNDLRGPSNSLTHREASSNLAVGEAYRTIVRGSADRMLAGATGTRIHPMKAVHAVQSEQLAIGNGDPTQASRPFDAQRQGMVLGEGAGVVVLEELEAAQSRGATVLAEVVGEASSFCASARLIANRRQALANAMRGALSGASHSTGDVGHIHAHGLATESCDEEEAAAIGEVFGDRRVPVLAAKSYFGNLGAGSGLVELIASVMSLSQNGSFATLNYEYPDSRCPLAVVTDGQTPPGDSFINVSVTPQGQAAAVLVRKPA